MQIGQIYTGIETGVEVEIVGFAGDLVKYEFCNPHEGFAGIQFCRKEDFERTTQLKGKQTKEEFIKEWADKLNTDPANIDAGPCEICGNCGEWLIQIKKPCVNRAEKKTN